LCLLESLLFMNFLFFQKVLFYIWKQICWTFAASTVQFEALTTFFLAISLFYIPYLFYSLLLAILRFRVEFSTRCVLSSWRAICKVSGIFLGISLLLEIFELKSISVLFSPGGVSEYRTQITRSKQTRDRSSFSYKIL
jgi:hypothetical protein